MWQFPDFVQCVLLIFALSALSYRFMCFFFEIPENQLDFRNVHRGWWNDTSKRGAVIYTAPEIFEKLCFSAQETDLDKFWEDLGQQCLDIQLSHEQIPKVQAKHMPQKEFLVLATPITHADCCFHHTFMCISPFTHKDKDIWTCLLYMFGSCHGMFVAKTLSMNSCLDMLRPLCCRNETFQVKDDELLDFQSDESYIAGHE